MTKWRILAAVPRLGVIRPLRGPPDMFVENPLIVLAFSAVFYGLYVNLTEIDA